MDHSCLSVNVSFIHSHYIDIHNQINSFKFTKLDKDDPSRPFTCTLSMNEDNQEYILSSVNPSLDVNKTNPILDELNKDGKSGFNSFAVGMSKSLLFAIISVLLIMICSTNVHHSLVIRETIH